MFGNEWGNSRIQFLVRIINYNITRNNISKSLLNSECLWKSATCYKQRGVLFLVTKPPAYWKLDSCSWILWKDEKRIKANLYYNTLHKFWDQSPSLINVVCKYLEQCLGTSFGVSTLPIYCNIDQGEGA